MRTKSNKQIDQAELLRVVGSLLNNKLPSLAAIRAVFIKDESRGWEYLIGKCELSIPREDIEEIYSDCAFICKTINNFSLQSFLQALENEGYPISEKKDFVLQAGDGKNIKWYEEVIPSHATESEYPARCYNAKINNRVYFHDGLVLGFNMPFHLSSQKYIKQFMNMNSFHGSDDARKGEMLIELADFRGRIYEQEGTVSINGNTKEICLVGQTQNQSNIILHPGDKIKCNEQELNQAELWLITKENEILDYRSQSEWQYRLENIESESGRVSRILQIIDGGEGYKCEFKKYIDVSESKGKKSKDIEKAVCAFSNSEGGHLFLGITDDGCIEGIDTEICGTYNTNLEEAIELYKKDIKKQLTEKLRDNQCFNLSSIKCGSNHIIVITVKRSSKTNYYLDTRDAYARRGATSFKMSSSEEREHFENFQFDRSNR